MGNWFFSFIVSLLFACCLLLLSCSSLLSGLWWLRFLRYSLIFTCCSLDFACCMLFSACYLPLSVHWFLRFGRCSLINCSLFLPLKITKNFSQLHSMCDKPICVTNWNKIWKIGSMYYWICNRDGNFVNSYFSLQHLTLRKRRISFLRVTYVYNFIWMYMETKCYIFLLNLVYRPFSMWNYKYIMHGISFSMWTSSYSENLDIKITNVLHLIFCMKVFSWQETFYPTNPS